MSGILGPNGHPIPKQIELSTATIGGQSVQYNGDPEIAVVINPEQLKMLGITIAGNNNQPLPIVVFADPGNLCAFLGASINIDNMLIREVVSMRKRVEDLEERLEIANKATARLEPGAEA